MHVQERSDLVLSCQFLTQTTRLHTPPKETEKFAWSVVASEWRDAKRR
jgi:hypothetical protein